MSDRGWRSIDTGELLPIDSGKLMQPHEREAYLAKLWKREREVINRGRFSERVSDVNSNAESEAIDADERIAVRPESTDAEWDPGFTLPGPFNVRPPVEDGPDVCQK